MFLNREGAKGAKGVFGFFLIGEGSYQEKKTLLRAEHLEMVLGLLFQCCSMVSLCVLCVLAVWHLFLNREGAKGAKGFLVFS